MIGNNEFGSSIRKRTFLIATALVVAVFTFRLVQLQLIEGSRLRMQSEAQGIKRITREPVRGAIYDRNGAILVANVASYSVYVTPNKLDTQGKMTLARILGTDTATINEKIRQYKTNDYSPVRIWRDIEYPVLAMLNEFHAQLSGTEVIDESKRAYAPDVHASHVLGYTGEINERELNSMGADYYTPGDVVGKAGVEQEFETMLRGEKGFDFVAVNNRGQRVASFNDGKNDLDPLNGFDLYMGFDAGLQQYAEQLLEGKRGAVVALDPNNGELLAMASAPDYDPMLFSGVVRSEDYAMLRDDPGKPLLNRTTQAIYPPGSTWKMLMAIAGLGEGVITPSSTISCPGSFTLGGNTWKCHGAHGSINVRRAIQASCNVFFYKLSLQLGIDNYQKYGRLFHFGEKLGVDVPEGTTLLPSRAYLDKKYGQDKWPKGILVNLGIGQGELLVNPLQLAAYCGALANGGTWHEPHLVRAVKNKRLGTVEPVAYRSEDLGISPEIMNIVRQGMYDVVNVPGGTAGIARLSDITVAGKTGTAQAPGGKKDHAWFVCFAPFDNPKIALCVLVENVGFGGTHAAPIARKLVHYYLKRKKEPGDEQPEREPAPPNSLPYATDPDTVAPPPQMTRGEADTNTSASSSH